MNNSIAEEDKVGSPLVNVPYFAISEEKTRSKEAKSFDSEIPVLVVDDEFICAAAVQAHLKHCGINADAVIIASNLFRYFLECRQ